MMNPGELQNYLHVYSMFAFIDGRNEAGIMISRYNIAELQVEYYFVSHQNMSEYKEAFDSFDMSTCNRLCLKVETDDIVGIHPVSLKDYKAIMQLTSLNNKRINASR